jgi:DNA-binding MarR family transcriptional regulator
LPRQVLSTQAPSEQGLAAWIQLLRSHAALTRELSARLEAGHGLSLRDYDVLVQLYWAPDRRLRRIDLARTVILSPSGVTRLLDGLERAGWVAKDDCASDGRVTYAVLTDSGLEKFEQARVQHHADIQELFASQFTPEECIRLEQLLGRLPLADAGACNSE